jgi:hypothetical protein
VKALYKERRFFFEKKKQKTFAPFGPGDVSTSRVKVAKVFCALFFKKAHSFLGLQI